MSSKLMDGFINPHPDYRPVTMWHWSDVLTEDEITKQLESFKNKGIIDFFVNPVVGFEEDYLSEHYFEIVKYTVKEAKRLGLSFWIYDEYEFPSGLAGGKLLRDRPDVRGKVMRDTKTFMDPGYHIRKRYAKGELVKAFITYPFSKGVEGTDVTDKVVVEKTEEGFYYSYKNESCEYVNLHIMASYLQEYVQPACRGAKFSFAQEGYIDPLREDAIRAFIDYTHEKYKEAVGEEFGKTVKGLFTDEVCVGAPQDVGEYRVPWNDEIIERFKARYGYDMSPWLYALIDVPVTLKEKQVRYHYWRLLTERVRDAHIKQVYEWCDKENLLYTGHFDGEETLVAGEMYQSGDIFDLMEWMHVPGIDSIFSRTNINNENFNMAGKILGSCARFFNRDRTLCETWTGSSYKLRFDEMRRIANRLMLLGANMIQYMGSHYSRDNQRKAWKPSFDYSNPMFDRFDIFGDYLARVQYVSAQTKMAGRVLLMCPLSGVYTGYDGRVSIFTAPRSNEDFVKYDIVYIALMNLLLELNVEYDMFSDSMADKVTVENGHAYLFGGEYDTIIIPEASDTTSSVFKLVERLRAEGVKVIFVDDLPQIAVDEGKVVSPFGKTPESGEVRCIADNVYFMSEPREKQRRGNNADFKRKLKEAVGGKHTTLDIRHNGDILTALRAAEDGTRVVFICNDSGENKAADIAYKEGMQLLDPATGKACEMTVVGGRAQIEFTPYQFYILVTDGDASVETESKLNTAAFRKLAPVCGFEAEDGNILAAQWKYAPCDYEGGAIVVPEESSFKQLNAEGELHTDNFVPCKRGVLVYDFDVEYIPEKVRLIAEYAYVLRCELNGERIDDKWSSCRLWGPRDAEFDVAKLLKKGKNRLTLVFEGPDWYTRFFVPFLQFRGEFEVANGRMCVKRESYIASAANEQGHPRAYGNGIYTFKANLTKEEAEQAVAVSLDSHDAVELIVNGKSAGVCLWSPYKFNTEGLFAEGENTVVCKTTMPMHNIFCPEDDFIKVGLKDAPVLEKAAK